MYIISNIFQIVDIDGGITYSLPPENAFDDTSGSLWLWTIISEHYCDWPTISICIALQIYWLRKFIVFVTGTGVDCAFCYCSLCGAAISLVCGGLRPAVRARAAAGVAAGAPGAGRQQRHHRGLEPRPGGEERRAVLGRAQHLGQSVLITYPQVHYKRFL